MRLAVSILLIGCGAKDDECIGANCIDTGSACTGPECDDPPATGTGGSGGGTGGGTTLPPPTGIRVLAAGFGWDPATSTVVGITDLEGAPVAPFVTVGAMDGLDVRCTVTLRADGPLIPRVDGWVADKGLTLGVEIPADTIESDCDLSDPAWDERMALVPTQTWGIGLQPLNDTTQAYAMAALGEDWFPQQFQALSVGWYWSELEGAFDGSGYMDDPLGFATDVRADLSLVAGLDGEPVRLDAEAALPPEGPVRAWYSLDASYVTIELR
ncbi:MAG: hypothetical protein ACI8PZ_002606 [Myxococcota bacterium]|jgi:hypothetical protein